MQFHRTTPASLSSSPKSKLGPEKRHAFGFLALALGFLASGIDGVLRPYVAIAAGYAAKVGATAVLIAGRDADSVEDEELAFLPGIRLVVDRTEPSVEASLLAVPWVSRKAIVIEGRGAVLLPEGVERIDLPTVTAGTPTARDPVRPWPEGEHVESVSRPGLDQAIATVFGDEGSDPLRTRAVIVVEKGRIVAERYARGCDASTILPGWSMTKSVTCALVGLRVADGALSLPQPAGFPEWRDDARSAITLEDLLRMQSGLEFDEDYAEPSSHVLRMLYHARDMAGFAAQSPLRSEPGRRFQYSSGSSLLVQRMLRATFRNDLEYAVFPTQRLFQPLGCSSARLECDASGTFVGSSYAHMTARDWARFGLFLERDGAWGGKRLLPDGFLGFAATPTAAAPNGEYGAHLWLNRGTSTRDPPYPSLPRDLRIAAGYEGQYIVIVPSKQLVIVRLGLTPAGTTFPLENFVAAILAAS